VRVCLLTPEYGTLTPDRGGIGTHFAGLAPELARQGHETHVLTLSASEPRDELHEGASVHQLSERIPRRLWPINDLARTHAFAGALRELGPFDVVYAPEWGGAAALYARRQTQGPLITNLTTSLVQILTIMSGWNRGRRLRVKHAIQARLERSQTQRSTGLVASTRAILDWARHLWNVATVPSTVIPNLVDIDRVRAARDRGAPPPGFPPRGPVVAFSGRLESRKGVHVLAQAMRRVWSEIPDARLVLLGEDREWHGRPMSGYLRELAGPYVDRLHWMGRQPPERLFPALGAADVVALPSLWENHALAAIEAMALGRALVATSGSGFEEMVQPGHDGVLVSPSDPVALAEAIVRLLRDPALRTRLGEAAAASTECRFASEPVARRHVEWFEAVAAGRAR
jgi:glycosyltransferase involved in cell wall biosynthesis